MADLITIFHTKCGPSTYSFASFSTTPDCSRRCRSTGKGRGHRTKGGLRVRDDRHLGDGGAGHGENRGRGCGANSVFEDLTPPGAGPVPHTHSREDETIFVVECELRTWLGGKEFDVKPGDFVDMRRGSSTISRTSVRSRPDSCSRTRLVTLSHGFWVSEPLSLHRTRSHIRLNWSTSDGRCLPPGDMARTLKISDLGKRTPPDRY